VLTYLAQIRYVFVTSGGFDLTGGMDFENEGWGGVENY